MVAWMAIGLAAWAGEGAPTFDHGYARFDAFLGSAVSTAGVDYDDLATRRPDLDAFLAQVASADVAAFTKDQQVAFWVNAYNAHTIALILDHRPLASIRDLDDGNPWKARTFAVAGAQRTLDEMEHQHARKLADGRVHSVINCASKGCPPLPADPILPAGLDASLDAHARRWVATNAYAVEGTTLGFSKIFDWYAEDFTRWRGPPAPGATPAQAAALGFVVAFGGDIATPGEPAYAWIPYDWSLNVAP